MNLKLTNVSSKLQLLQLPSSGCRRAILAGTCITEMHSHLALQCKMHLLAEVGSNSFSSCESMKLFRLKINFLFGLQVMGV